MASKKIPQPIKEDLSNKSLVLILLVLLIVCMLSLGLYLTLRANTTPLTIGGAVIFGSENVPPTPSKTENQYDPTSNNKLDNNNKEINNTPN